MRWTILAALIVVTTSAVMFGERVAEARSSRRVWYCAPTVSYQPTYQVNCNPWTGCRVLRTYQPRIVYRCRPITVPQHRYGPPIQISPIYMR